MAWRPSAVAAALTLACTDTADVPSATDAISASDCDIQPTWASIQSGYFQPACNFVPCHGGSAVRSGLNLEQGTGYKALVGVESRLAPGVARVDPGDPDHSFLVWKLEGTLREGHGELMPPSAEAPLDPDCRIRRIREWIAKGAPPG